MLRETLAAGERQATLRVAGGWVRDRLLGRPCRDLDIVADAIDGHELARRVARRLEHLHGWRREELAFRGNPARSRHLSTGFLRFRGLEIEFLQLRRERYDSQTRIPTVEVEGVTLLEDARRRDFTVNALYFDIEAGRVVDPLCQGWFDLQARVLRPTQDAISSFLDDPLRILRAIRFAARLDFALALPWRTIAKEGERPWQDVLRAFETKVSGERMWWEWLGRPNGSSWSPGCLMGPRPVRAFELLELFGLRELLFSARPADDPRAKDFVSSDPRPQAILAQRSMQRLEGDSLSLAVARMAATFAGHPAGTAADLARRVLERTRCPEGFARRVVALVEALHANVLAEAWGRRPFPWKVLCHLGDDTELLLALSEALEAARDPFGARSHEDLRSALAERRNLEAARGAFPLQGRDLLERGFSRGPELGRVLLELQRMWNEDPTLDRDTLLTRVPPPPHAAH